MAESEAFGINDRGDIVGVSSDGESPPVEHAFVWRKGHMIDLGDFTPLNDSIPVAINALGEVIVADGVWRGGASFVEPPTLGGGDFGIAAINDRGQIAGWSTTKAGKKHAVLWSPRRG